MSNTLWTKTAAEATVEAFDDKVVKTRKVKGYRHQDLDRRLRATRTKLEASLLEKLGQGVPKVLSFDKETGVIEMERIDGPPIKEILAKDVAKQVGEQVGKVVGLLHDADVIHGDLTTSNMIERLADKQVILIDFGLASHSGRVEDKAMDLHILEQSVQAMVPEITELFLEGVFAGYANSKDSDAVHERLDVIKSRGRYKGKA